LKIFPGKKSNEELKKISDECMVTLKNFINTCSDQNRLNMMFTEITIFRMKYDIKDGILQNILDRKKRQINIERNALIIVQMEDIFENISSYEISELDELNNLMSRILPPAISSNPNGWNNFWSSFWQLFDRGAGKK